MPRKLVLTWPELDGTVALNEERNLGHRRHVSRGGSGWTKPPSKGNHALRAHPAPA